MKRIYKVVLEVEDLDNKGTSEVEQLLEEALAYLPDDLIANIVSCDDEEGYEDY